MLMLVSKKQLCLTKVISSLCLLEDNLNIRGGILDTSSADYMSYLNCFLMHQLLLCFFKFRMPSVGLLYNREY